jgi:ribosomal protein S18 acetylase RimI-like enzyme
MIINYKNSIETISHKNLTGFFVGWPSPPSNETLMRILNGSYRFIIAMDEDRVVGFINAVSDGVLSAYIPLLEVLPEYQSRGIGKELVTKMREELKHLYMVDLLCDEELVPYYEKQGMSKSSGVFIRNYENQCGHKVSND